MRLSIPPLARLACCPPCAFNITDVELEPHNTNRLRPHGSTSHRESRRPPTNTLRRPRRRTGRSSASLKRRPVSSTFSPCLSAAARLSQNTIGNLTQRPGCLNANSLLRFLRPSRSTRACPARWRRLQDLRRHHRSPRRRLCHLLRHPLLRLKSTHRHQGVGGGYCRDGQGTKSVSPFCPFVLSEPSLLLMSSSACFISAQTPKQR